MNDISFISKNVVIPTVQIAKIAQQKMEYLVAKVSTEVAWLGYAEWFEKENIIVVHDIFVPKQEVHATKADIEADELLRIAEQLISEGAMDEYNMLRFHGHSHVNMGVSPSVTDNETMNDYSHCPWFLRAIYNKRKESRYDLFWWEKNICVSQISHLTIDPMPNGVREELDRNIKERVLEAKSITVQVPSRSYQQRFEGYYGPYDSRNQLRIGDDDLLDKRRKDVTRGNRRKKKHGSQIVWSNTLQDISPLSSEEQIEVQELRGVGLGEDEIVEMIKENREWKIKEKEEYLKDSSMRQVWGFQRPDEEEEIVKGKLVKNEEGVYEWVAKVESD